MKALASDLDGTLLVNHRYISKENLKAIDRFQKAGNLFGICTGRSVASSINAKDFRCDFIIASTGAQIMIGSKYIYEKPVCFEYIESIFNQYYLQATSIVIQAKEDSYSWKSKHPILKEFKAIEQLKNLTIYGISLDFPTEEETIEVNKQILKDYPGLICHQNEKSIDIVDVHCSKGAGVQIIKDYLKIDTIGGIGDSYNDISMLESADVSFTFPTSPKTVQDKATALVNSVTEAIEYLLK